MCSLSCLVSCLCRLLFSPVWRPGNLSAALFDLLPAPRPTHCSMCHQWSDDGATGIKRVSKSSMALRAETVLRRAV